MMKSYNIQPYFDRIGFNGKAAPDLETLGKIQRLHAETIPFENLNPLFRIPVALDIPSLENKLLRAERGGYCFEHNHLLKAVLEALGFRVKGLGARVLWGLPDGTITARGHMLLLVDVKGERYIADAGFGGVTLTAPLRLELDVVQKTPHEDFRLIQPGEDFVLQVHVKAEWKPVFRFNLQEQFLPDYEVTNWYLSNNPSSHFVNSLIVTRPAPGVRHVLRNNQYTRHYVDGTTEKEDVTSVASLRKLLKETFFIEVPENDQANSTFERIIQSVVTSQTPQN
jgi:N-hydroxyarylamine O-acetyltransferase